MGCVFDELKTKLRSSENRLIKLGRDPKQRLGIKRIIDERFKGLNDAKKLSNKGFKSPKLLLVASGIISGAKAVSLIRQSSDQKIGIKVGSKKIIDSLNSQKKKLLEKVKDAQKQPVKDKAAIKQAQDVVNKLNLVLKNPTLKKIKKIKKLIQKVVPKLTKPSKKRLIPLITWRTKLPRGIRPRVNAVVRIKGQNKELKFNLPPNKAFKKISKLVDNTTTRSFMLKIVGITKAKDIVAPSRRKFRPRRGKDPRVLIFVERSKFALDTKGELAQISLARRLKRK